MPATQSAADQLTDIELLLAAAIDTSRSAKLSPEARNRYRWLLSAARTCIGAARDILELHDADA